MIFKSAIDSLNLVDEFLNNNLKENNISVDTTVEELIFFINNAKETVIPLMMQIDEVIANKY